MSLFPHFEEYIYIYIYIYTVYIIQTASLQDDTALISLPFGLVDGLQSVSVIDKTRFLGVLEKRLTLPLYMDPMTCNIQANQHLKNKNVLWIKKTQHYKKSCGNTSEIK